MCLWAEITVDAAVAAAIMGELGSACEHELREAEAHMAVLCSNSNIDTAVEVLCTLLAAEGWPCCSAAIDR